MVFGGLDDGEIQEFYTAVSERANKYNELCICKILEVSGSFGTSYILHAISLQGKKWLC